MKVIDGKNFLKICFHTLLLVGGIVLGFLIISKRITLDTFKSPKQETKEEEKVEKPVASELLETQLLQDLNDHVVDIDGYIKNLLFAEYDRDFLENRYASLKTFETPLDTDYIVYQYANNISESVLRYYLGRATLKGVTFDANKFNNEPSSDSAVAFSDPVYAKDTDKNINLNHVLISGNGNFVIWYTDSGSSAITERQAQDIGYNLEVARYAYDKMYNKYFKFKADFVVDGNINKKQTELLKAKGINNKKLTTAMQVYVLNYTETASAKYVLTGDKLLSIYNKFEKNNTDGTIPGPYLIVNAKAYKNDKERAMQIINRELFRHYQYNVFCPESTCIINDDPYYFDALATYGSAAGTKKSTNKGFINEWAALARVSSQNIFNEELVKKYGQKNVANSLAVYLSAYASAVPEGDKKLVDALYQSDPFKKLEERAGDKYLTEAIQTVALGYLKLDFNNNLIASPEFQEKFVAKDHLYDSKDILDEEIKPLGIAYYILDKDEAKNYTIEFGRSTAKVSCLLLGFKDGVYRTVAKSPVSSVSVQFKTANYTNYERYYLVIANATILDSNYYSLKIVLE